MSPNVFFRREKAAALVPRVPIFHSRMLAVRLPEVSRTILVRQGTGKALISRHPIFLEICLHLGVIAGNRLKCRDKAVRKYLGVPHRRESVTGANVGYVYRRVSPEQTQQLALNL
jgi:hypothetical protein